MTTPNPHLLRKLGDIEHFSSSRHHLGIYRCVTVTARHQHPPSSSSSHLTSTSPSPAFLAALSHVVRHQPMLRVGIAADDSNDAHFTHIPSIDLRDHVSVTLIPCQTAQEYEDRVAQQQGWEHDQKFANIAERPPWRITILRPSGDVPPELQGIEDVFFAFHHALMDGTSGRLFHEMLLAAPSYQGSSSSSSSSTSDEADPVLSFPNPPSLPESQEQGIDFTLSWSYTLRTLWTELGPSFLKPAKQPIWNAIPIDLSLPYRTRVKAIDYSPEQLSLLLSACRSHGVTLTALLHSLVLTALAKRIASPEEAPAFAAATPLSLRPYLSPVRSDPAHASSLRCLVAGCSHEFSPDAVAALRAQDADVNALIWRNAQHVKAELAQKLAKIPQDDIMGLLKYISDWFAFWRGRDGKQRADSWEISNIGVLKNNNPQTNDAQGEHEDKKDEEGDEAGIPRATRLLFTNGAMVAGPPMGINVASVAGSAFTIGLSWQDRVVEEELMERLAEDLVSFAARFQETGDSFV
ncbi:alcohol acetyltransferase [Trichoderma gracile]